MIPYGRQTIEDDDIQAVIEVLKSDFLTTGPKSTEFEEAVKSYTGSRYAVAISMVHQHCMRLVMQQALDRGMR